MAKAKNDVVNETAKAKHADDPYVCVIDFSAFLDNAELSDPAGEWFNSTAFRFVEKMLEATYYQLKYNDERLATAMGKADTAYDNAVRIYGEDCAFEQESVAVAYGYLAQYDNRSSELHSMVAQLSGIYYRIAGSAPISYEEYKVELEARLRKSRRPVKVSANVEEMAALRQKMKSA